MGTSSDFWKRTKLLLKLPLSDVFTSNGPASTDNRVLYISNGHLSSRDNALASPNIQVLQHSGCLAIATLDQSI